MRVQLLLFPLLLAGCAAPAAIDDVPAAGQDATTPFVELAACTAHNAFLMTTEDVLRPYVPANWTFTQLASPQAILRMFHVVCDDGRALLTLSTPMVPDEASREWHDNPDVVIDVFTTEAETLDAWNATGARAAIGEFTTAPFPGGESLIVFSEGQLVLGLDILPVSPVATTGTYEFQAVYAAGVDPIGWFWGDEIANETSPRRFATHLGPATRVDAADAQPHAAGSRWERIDLVYAPGVPPAESRDAP